MGRKRIDIKGIKRQIKEEGYKNKLISYEELQKLHKKYANRMLEVDFASKILGVSVRIYKRFPHDGLKVRVLKEKELSRQGKIIKEQLKEKGYVGKTIDYEEIQQLYKEYGQRIPEKVFIQEILSVSANSYSSCKNRGTRVRVLKEEKKNVDRKQKTIDLGENACEVCVGLLNKYKELGYSREKAIEMTERKLNIDATKILDYMQEYLYKKPKKEFTRKPNRELDER